MSPRVLILSSKYDFSTDLVALRLEKANVPFIRLNREQLPECRLSLDPIETELIVRSPAGSFHIDSNLSSVWFRQPVFLRNTPAEPLTPREQLERSQWMAFLRSLAVFTEARWMNAPASTYLAESKPYQLNMAKKCGFAIPQTLITNDVAQVHRHFSQDMVIKSLDTVLLRDGDDCLFTYTTLTSSSSLTDQNVAAAPLLVQEYLSDKIDIRVTIVGDAVFSVAILAMGKGIPGDWRTIPREQIEYVNFPLPSATKSACLKLMAALGLSFGAIDLIQASGHIYFIEINPTGEWGWLCSEAAQIDIEIASWLSKH